MCIRDRASAAKPKRRRTTKAAATDAPATAAEAVPAEAAAGDAAEAAPKPARKRKSAVKVEDGAAADHDTGSAAVAPVAEPLIQVETKRPRPPVEAAAAAAPAAAPVEPAPAAADAPVIFTVVKEPGTELPPDWDPPGLEREVDENGQPTLSLIHI